MFDNVGKKLQQSLNNLLRIAPPVKNEVSNSSSRAENVLPINNKYSRQHEGKVEGGQNINL